MKTLKRIETGKENGNTGRARLGTLKSLIAIVAFLTVIPAPARALDSYFNLDRWQSKVSDSAVNFDRMKGVSSEEKQESAPASQVNFGENLGMEVLSHFHLNGDVDLFNRGSEMREAAGLPLQPKENVSSVSFLVDGYYDFNMGESLTSYVGGGIGFTRTSVSDIDSGLENSAMDLAYQVTVGMKYKVSPKSAFGLSLKYRGTEAPDLAMQGGLPIGAENNNAKFNLNVNYYF
ncbi:MAG: porin family protein [candidate division Zixibacteria bacterium]|nr:porin family protein [candidate division Zixibacteria bacterium]NIW39445.1 outer membrane beta-barrel protein [candidate division Zixibacteria bacterium]NIX57457.1 outer membrane beta-barrel protein [candidate division Zixibacteria bacterium]